MQKLPDESNSGSSVNWVSKKLAASGLNFSYYTKAFAECTKTEQWSWMTWRSLFVLANWIAFKSEELQGRTCDEIDRREFAQEA